jgi:hypothetical protein
MNKTCTKCNEKKSIDSFHKNKKNEDGRHYHCKACRKEESLKLYGLSLQDYDDLLASQDGCCKICKTTDPRGQSKAGRFYVDHNHTTGKVRGLLCNDCNTAIGLLKDSPKTVAKALEYLLEEGYYGQ